MSAITGAKKDEFVTSMACLALYDGDAEITAANISALLTASNNTVAPYWPGLFAGFCENGKLDEVVYSTGGGGAGGAAAVGGGEEAGGDAAGDAPAEKPKEEEVDALEGGMDMFGGGGGGGDY
mmetsp:Transcript_115396/g.326136  ORF Transcript_115396/g.326136 Transcript_115396/m.326136 type:complete len:123 (-) Transcript_115396:114-482(-)